MFKAFLLLIGLLFAAPLVAQDTTAIERRLILLPGVCTLYDPDLTEPSGELTSIASSAVDIPCRALIINPRLFNNLPEAVAMFSIMHEFGHISLKHLAKGSVEQLQQQEEEADCFGAIMIKKYWPQLISSLRQHIGLYAGASPIHGTSQQRVDRIFKCLDNK